MAENDFATGYMCGQSDNGGRSGGWGFDLGGIIALVVIASLFGGFGGFGGRGGFGGGGGMMMLNGMATRADINEGFALNNITSGITAIQQGICDSTYALTNGMNNGFHNQTVATMQGFNGVERGFCDLSHQLSDCCCENRAAIAQVRYDMANQTRDVIEAGNANHRALMDFLTQDKISTLTAENQSLKFAASQAAQNNYLAAMSDAQTAEIIRRVAPTPVPSYNVPAPYPYVHGYDPNCQRWG